MLHSFGFDIWSLYVFFFKSIMSLQLQILSLVLVFKNIVIQNSSFSLFCFVLFFNCGWFMLLILIFKLL